MFNFQDQPDYVLFF